MKFPLEIFISLAMASALPNGEDLTEDRRYTVTPSYTCHRAGFNCGIRSTMDRIVGGKVVKKNSIPWLVYIQIGRNINSGVIIGPYTIISAGHCFSPDVVANPHQITVKVQEHNVDEDDGEVKHKVSCVLPHPDYDYHGNKFNKDFALLILEDAINLNGRAAAVCLPGIGKNGHYDSYENKRLTVSGWGRMSETSDYYPNVPLHVEVYGRSKTFCRRRYWKFNEFMLCANAPPGSSRHGNAYIGDSGGPLTYFNRKLGRHELVGLVSHGKARVSNSIPVVYARITSVLEWIKRKGFNEKNKQPSCIILIR